MCHLFCCLTPPLTGCTVCRSRVPEVCESILSPPCHLLPRVCTQEEPHIRVGSRTPAPGQGHRLTLDLLLELSVWPNPARDYHLWFLEHMKLGTLERAGLEPTNYWLQVSHSTTAPRLCHRSEFRPFQLFSLFRPTEWRFWANYWKKVEKMFCVPFGNVKLKGILFVNI